MITAKQFEIIEIDEEKALAFLSDFHYLKDTPIGGTNCYGAIYKEELVGVICFKEQRPTEYELYRLAMTDECAKNSESRFVSQAIKQFKEDRDIKLIFTIVEPMAGHDGTVYLACNFKKCKHDSGRHLLFTLEF